MLIIKVTIICIALQLQIYSVKFITFHTTQRNTGDHTVCCSDSLLSRRRLLRSLEEKVKPGGMTLPQLELWDRGRWV